LKFCGELLIARQKCQVQAGNQTIMADYMSAGHSGVIMVKVRGLPVPNEGARLFCFAVQLIGKGRHVLSATVLSEPKPV
jgi:hypothetical protein